MIRVPFFTAFEGKTEPVRAADSASAGTESDPRALRADRLEARLSALELRLVRHAEELRVQVSDRVMRIQSRLERAIRPFQPESERERCERSADNVVEFGFDEPRAEAVNDHLLHARNAREAMNELNETLRATRVHLEALSGSIERMRRNVAGR